MITRSQVGMFKPNPWFHGHTSHIYSLPKSPSVALSDPHWRDAMYDKYNALIKNGTWILVPKPPNVNVIRSMWLFRHKYHADGSLSKYKARLVANGRNQQYEVDCSDTFSPVVKPSIIRIILSLALARNWPVHQLDVKNTFLNGDLIETIYMYQPSGFVDSRFPLHACRLQRSLYGLKQAPRAWFQRFAGYVLRVGFTLSRCDSSLFIYQYGIEVAYLLIYVNDIVLTTSSITLLQRIISFLHKEFDMTDLGELNYFLGISVTRDLKGMFLSQKKHVMELLERAHVSNCNATRTPEQDGIFCLGYKVRDKKFLGIQFRERQGCSRLNIEKLYENIVQKHEGSKQVGFKQLTPGVETGVHEVHDEKRVWFEVELQGAQGDHEAEVFQVYTQCMKSGVAKHLGVPGILQQNGLVNETYMTFFAKGFFSWLASTKQEMLEPVKVKCIFLGYRKVRNTRKHSLVLVYVQGVEFEVEPQKDHTFEVEPHGNVDHVVGSQEVQTQDLMEYQLVRDRDQHLACELFGYKEDDNEAAFAVAASDVYVLSKGCKKCSDNSDGYYWEYTQAKGNILGMEIVRDQSGNTLRVSQFRFYNEKLVQTFLEGPSILLLEGSLSGDCDVEKNESRYELRLIAGIATGALVKGGSRSKVPAKVEVAAYRIHMHDPREPHLAALKRGLHYIRGTLDHGLQLHVSSTSQLNAYTDVTLSRSSTEAEYRGVANVVAETAWIRNLL
uniref:Ribonuclease H-like domain-containing protein n=1 Tax=Tanacetum cinerariifolium TaxID=118510 RepID=A0A699IBN2_TANCI|nr:ribonuclease H-like domain-containing protein [Tanacetum cinerariifolium]